MTDPPSRWSCKLSGISPKTTEWPPIHHRLEGFFSRESTQDNTSETNFLGPFKGEISVTWIVISGGTPSGLGNQLLEAKKVLIHPKSRMNLGIVEVEDLQDTYANPINPPLDLENLVLVHQNDPFYPFFYNEWDFYYFWYGNYWRSSSTS